MHASPFVIFGRPISASPSTSAPRSYRPMFIKRDTDYRPEWGCDNPIARPLNEIVAYAIDASQAYGSPSPPVAYSLEVFPPKTPAGFAKLRATLRSLRRCAPAFIDVTFAAGGASGGAAREATLAVCDYAQHALGCAAVMHVTGRGESVEDTAAGIDLAIQAGIRNFMALRGDAPALETGGDLPHAVDLVQRLRAHAEGEHLGIAVAGYPEAHPESKDEDEDIDRLREKVDAGADIVVSQLFLDAQKFLRWKARCIEKGIEVPIVPGIIFVTSIAGIERMLKLCVRVTVPPEVRAEIDTLKTADAATVTAFGVRLASKMCQELYDSGERFFHFYTLNQDQPLLQLLKTLNWMRPAPPPLPAFIANEDPSVPVPLQMSPPSVRS